MVILHGLLMELIEMIPQLPYEVLAESLDFLSQALQDCAVFSQGTDSTHILQSALSYWGWNLGDIRRVRNFYSAAISGSSINLWSTVPLRMKQIIRRVKGSKGRGRRRPTPNARGSKRVRGDIPTYDIPASCKGSDLRKRDKDSDKDNDGRNIIV